MIQMEKASSPNQSSRGSHAPKLIVCHIADGTYEGTKGWFGMAKSMVSSHFIVAQDGRICQCVPLEKMAWCNGTTTKAGDLRHYSFSTVPLVRELGGNANQYSVSIECEGFYSKTKGALTEQQLAALVELIQHIRDRVQEIYSITIPLDRDHIVGHFEINPKTKPHCPGEMFPWAELMRRLRVGADSQAPTEKLYRVQVGAFKSKANAQAMLKRLVAAGYPAILVSGDYYRVQVGAFTSKVNAEKQKAALMAAGFVAVVV